MANDEAFGEALGMAVVRASLQASRSVVQSWEERSNRRLPPQLDFTIRMEMLAAYLHIVNRIAASEHGSHASDYLQHAIAGNAIGRLIAVSWDAGSSEMGDEQAQDWFVAMRAEVLHFVNDAHFDYRNCEGTSSEMGGVDDEIGVESKLATRICQGLRGYQGGDGADYLGLKTLIISASINNRATSRLVQETRWTCQELG